jgi:hypothetical protein
MHLPRSESPVYAGLSLSQQVFGDLYGRWPTSGRYRPSRVDQKVRTDTGFGGSRRDPADIRELTGLSFDGCRLAPLPTVHDLCAAAPKQSKEHVHTGATVTHEQEAHSWRND